jgi:hypothetical protein
MHSVKVRSKYLRPTQDSFFVLDQELIFYKNGKEVLKKDLPFKSLEIDFLNTKVKIAKSVLLKAKCIVKKNKTIYSFYGSHAFDPQHEFFSLNNEKGEWLWYYYGDKYEVYDKFGSESKYVEEFGDELSSLDEMIKIFPY